jgi:hypothetical protein
MRAREFFELAARDIFYTQGYKAIPFNEPKVVLKTKDTAEAMAGNLRLCLCETNDKPTLDLFLKEASKAKDLGLGLRVNEHFVSDGCYFIEAKVPVCWYLTAINNNLQKS